MKQVYVETYGCQMNVADSDLVSGILKEKGYGLTQTPEEADAILINTCAVREHAEDRVYGRIGELAQYKHARPDVIIGVLGCMAQHLKDKLLQKSRFVDIVAGPDSYRNIHDLLEQAASERVMDVRLDHQEIYDGIVPARREGISAFLTVQRGCDKVCAFCIVPAVRGRERCVPLDDVVAQVGEMADSGVREITLLGQTVNSYRSGQHDFADLLLAVSQVPGIMRIRYTSPYPTDFTDKLIEVLASEKKIAKHVHLPLQSGSDKLLRLMKRRYNIRQFETILCKLRSAIPGVAVSTDIIVGFHDEDENDFQLTYDFVKRMRFDFAFMFKYSKRSNTAAYRREEEISEQTKSERLQTIITMQENISREIQSQCVGQTVEVLVEGISRKHNGQLFGRTSEFRQVVFQPTRQVEPGDIVSVRIEDSTGHTLIGAMTKKPTPDLVGSAN